MPDPNAERLARNEALFRKLNQAQPAEPEGSNDFYCECGDLLCTARVGLTLDEYLAVRSDRRRFLIVPGHQVDEVEQVVERHDGYWVVEKRPDLDEVGA
ncbi:MAG: hypothetical protein E6G56_05700 [Actinobacteria bacterium]|nr:MAG: hypothetical protein E6G56_05700 [Actinomycetota bacterium]